MKKFYLKLVETFIQNNDVRGRYTEKDIDPVQHIDLYSGQDLNPEYFELAIYPALFVQFSIDHQNELATITFRMCYEQLRDTSSQSTVVEEALKFFDFVELTDEIIQTIETESFGKLQPVTTEQQTEETVTDEFVLTYQTSYTKSTGKQNATGTYEDVEIKGNLFKNLL